MTRKVIAVGETVYDIIFHNDQPIAARPGGSMLNTAVSLGRLGIPVIMLTEYGNDRIGQQIDEFLTKNKVETGFIQRYKGRTRISTAFLNEWKDAEYTFYPGEKPSELSFDLPKINKCDIVLFGSFYSLKDENRNKIECLLEKSIKNGAIIYYDPNFRKAHLGDKNSILPVFMKNIEAANIIRGSNEDFELLTGKKTPTSVYEYLNIPAHLIYTQNKNNVEFINEHNHNKTEVPEIKPVSTIGAGDSFNAGIVFGISLKLEHKGSINTLTHSAWKSIIDYGIRCATNVCMSLDNHISNDFAKQISKEELL